MAHCCACVFLQWDTEKADGQYKKTASNAKLKKLNPNFKFTPIEEGTRLPRDVQYSLCEFPSRAGIAKSVKWFIDNYEKARK